MERLKELLKKIDRKGYKAYKTLTGSYEFPKFTLFIDHAQGDPFAIPSKIRMVVNQNMARFPKEHLATKIRRIALEDYVTRGVAKAIFKHAKGHRGTGKSGLISVQSCGQEVLERTSVKFDEGALEARLRLGLPAYGRTISAMDAYAMFFEEIPKIALDSLFYSRYDPLDLNKHLDLADDQQALRQQLKSLKLVSFVADGAGKNGCFYLPTLSPGRGSASSSKKNSWNGHSRGSYPDCRRRLSREDDPLKSHRKGSL